MPAFVTTRFPVTVDAPRMTALMSLIVTFAPEAETAPPKLLALFRVTSNPVAVTVVVPTMIRAPLFVTIPPAVTESAPDKFDAPISNADRSTTVTLFKPPAPTNETELAKSFPALSTEMSAPAAFAVKVAAPVMSSAPVLVMLPVVAVAANVPEAVDAPKINPLASTIDTAAPVVETAPVKSFAALAKVTLKPEADANVVPPMTNAPVLVIAPPAVTLRAPVKVNA